MAERQWYFLILSDKTFTAEHLPDWSQETFQALVNSGFFSQFKFDDTISTEKEVRSLLPEEHVLHSDRLQAKFSFTRVNMNIPETSSSRFGY
jgi:hypothetical protein